MNKKNGVHTKTFVWIVLQLLDIFCGLDSIYIIQGVNEEVPHCLGFILEREIPRPELFIEKENKEEEFWPLNYFYLFYIILIQYRLIWRCL